jgi:hypothetical protein
VEFERSGLEFKHLFASIAGGLEEFAARRGMVIERYVKDGPVWTLGFGHPLGGQAKLDVAATGDGRFRIDCYWWVDVWPDWIRKSRQGIPRLCQSSEVEQTLRDQLEVILNWDRKGFSVSSPLFKIPGCSEEEFERFCNPWGLLSSDA